jgi:hypothetical protein
MLRAPVRGAVVSGGSVTIPAGTWAEGVNKLQRAGQRLQEVARGLERRAADASMTEGELRRDMEADAATLDGTRDLLAAVRTLVETRDLFTDHQEG